MIPTVRQIIEASESVGNDVCLLGLVLAEEYANDDQDFEDIWSATQEMFDINTMEGQPYTFRNIQVRMQYAEKLHNYLKSGKYKFRSSFDR